MAWRAAAVQVHAHRDLGLLHHARAVFLAVLAPTAAAMDDVHLVEEEVDQRLVEVGDAGVAHRREDAAEIRVAGEEGRLHQRRMRDGA